METTTTVNPLITIGLFLALTEVALGFAATKTSGNIQQWLTRFAMFFPVLVLFLFFLLVWFKPHHLYGPGDYASPNGFQDAVHRAEDDSRERNAEWVQRLILELDSCRRFDDRISVQLPTTGKRTALVQFPPGFLKSFHELVTETYFSISDQVPPFTYGDFWYLVNDRGERLVHAREISGVGPGKPIDDNRSMESLGIKPGSRLKVVLIERGD